MIRSWCWWSMIMILTKDSQSSWRRTSRVASREPPFRACLYQHGISINQTIYFHSAHIIVWISDQHLDDQHKNLMCGTPGGAWTVNFAAFDCWDPLQQVYSPSSEDLLRAIMMVVPPWWRQQARTTQHWCCDNFHPWWTSEASKGQAL